MSLHHTVPIPVHPRRRSRNRKRPDVTTFIALLGLAGVIYLMETDIVSMQQEQLGDSANAPGDEGSSSNRRYMKGSLKTKDMEEFAVWVQEAAGSIADKDEIQRQRVSEMSKSCHLKPLFFFCSHNIFYSLIHSSC